MCGIFGYIGDKGITLKAATDIIHHRGPDADGFLQYYPIENRLIKNDAQPLKENGQRVLLGFRRLSIIDLDERANQPISDPSDNYHLIFNGEIYNYVEIREELRQLGYSFSTQSDSEVLLKSYIEWGKKCLEKFNGMWAFALLDLKQNVLFCSRDRFGIKPFYYHFDPQGNFYFASEIKQFFTVGVKKGINENVIKDFIDKNIVDSTAETFYKDIFHLPAAHYLEVPIKEKRQIQAKRYWELASQSSYENIQYDEAKNVFKELFEDSVRLRFRSDVPVGSCLSGGLDSSSIVAVASKIFDFNIHTFTSKFDIDRFNESEYVLDLAKKYKNIKTNFCQLNETRFKEEIEKVIYYQDEPFGTMSILAQWEVMKLAKENGVTVLLDGQGGDESLAGYRKFYAFYLKEKLQKLQVLKFGNAAFHLLKNREFDFFDFKEINRYLNFSSPVHYYSERGRNLTSYASIGLAASSTLNGRSKLDIERFSFPPLLRFEDRSSMAFSIETRVPFMDYRFVEFLYSIPSDFKIRKGYTKAILRDSLKGTLPKSIRKRISKLGFATPQEVWMENGLRSYFQNYFEQLDNPYFEKEQIVDLFKKYPQSGIFSNAFFFRVYCFDKWYQLNFK